MKTEPGSSRGAAPRESRIVEHFFRHEYGRLVASLCRIAGFHNVEAAEDAAQWALAKALEAWKLAGPPENPAGWLFRVAHNALRADLRQRALRRRLLSAQGLSQTGPPAAAAGSLQAQASVSASEPPLRGDVQDDLLRMLVACCDPGIAAETQIMLALKTLCGFGTDEIALRLFRSPASVYKRLSRARAQLRASWLPSGGQVEVAVPSALPAVRQMLYLLFTEGHLSCRAEEPIRRELCNESLRLARVLAQHPEGAEPETFALVALLHLQIARMPARQDASGGLLLLEEQDRSLWDASHVQAGLAWLERSAHGPTFSRYHAEAGIAAEHCMAPSYRETRWDRIADCYAQLEHASPSPLHRLNRALALAELRGAQAGIELLAGFDPPPWLEHSYQWAAVLADLHTRANNREQASEYQHRALAAAPTPSVRALLERRLQGLAPVGQQP